MSHYESIRAELEMFDAFATGETETDDLAIRRLLAIARAGVDAAEAGKALIGKVNLHVHVRGEVCVGCVFLANLAALSALAETKEEARK